MTCKKLVSFKAQIIVLGCSFYYSPLLRKTKSLQNKKQRNSFACDGESYCSEHSELILKFALNK